MTAQEFNDLTLKHAEEQLFTKGFKQAGLHYYIHNPPNIMVFYKKTGRGSFEGFYLALTHDFLTNTKDSKGNQKIPSYLEDFPISISMDKLATHYSKHKNVADFSYDLNFLSREVLTERNISDNNPLENITFNQIQHDEQKAGAYIKSSISILLNVGMKFFNEFSPVTSYLAIRRGIKADNAILNKFKEELEQYFISNNIKIPELKKSWFEKLF